MTGDRPKNFITEGETGAAQWRAWAGRSGYEAEVSLPSVKGGPVHGHGEGVTVTRALFAAIAICLDLGGAHNAAFDTVAVLLNQNPVAPPRARRSSRHYRS